MKVQATTKVVDVTVTLTLPEAVELQKALADYWERTQSNTPGFVAAQELGHLLRTEIDRVDPESRL